VCSRRIASIKINVSYTTERKKSGRDVNIDHRGGGDNLETVGTRTRKINNNNGGK